MLTRHPSQRYFNLRHASLYGTARACTACDNIRKPRGAITGPPRELWACCARCSGDGDKPIRYNACLSGRDSSFLSPALGDRMILLMTCNPIGSRSARHDVALRYTRMIGWVDEMYIVDTFVLYSAAESLTGGFNGCNFHRVMLARLFLRLPYEFHGGLGGFL